MIWFFVFHCSVSFYPQVISNFKRKSTVGLSPDFCVLNVIGFNCYTAYNAALYWNPSIQKLYKERYGPDAEITVQSNDVAFAIHALLLSLITLCQILYYDNNINSGNNETAVVRLSKPILVVIIGIAIICIVFPLMIVLDKKDGEQHNNYYYLDSNEYDESSSSSMGSNYNWLDFIYVLSYIKIFISLIKYIPQVLMNFRRKSTMGWSIWNILLDLTGGTLSDLQVCSKHARTKKRNCLRFDVCNAKKKRAFWGNIWIPLALYGDSLVCLCLSAHVSLTEYPPLVSRDCIQCNNLRLSWSSIAQI